MLNVALIAHDKMKPEMINFALENKEILSKCRISATGTTGSLIEEHTGLQVEKFLSGPLGGDQQIGSKISCQKIDVVIFLRDPLTAQPHEPDISALLRICDVHNVLVATNRKTADVLLHYIQDHLED